LIVHIHARFHNDSVVQRGQYERQLCTQAGEGIKLEVRSQDIWKKDTYVYLGEKLVMQIRVVSYANSYVPFSSNQWDIAVVECMN